MSWSPIQAKGNNENFASDNNVKPSDNTTIEFAQGLEVDELDNIEEFDLLSLSSSQSLFELHAGAFIDGDDHVVASSSKSPTKSTTVATRRSSRLKEKNDGKRKSTPSTSPTKISPTKKRKKK